MDGEVRGEVGGAAESAISGAAEPLEPRIERAREALAAWSQRAQRLVRENPGAALVCAAGLGFMIGRLASRR
jgi:ElaB/YqjD/DUF883 family membrane-anchored ribosome-binding protein